MHDARNGRLASSSLRVHVNTLEILRPKMKESRPRSAGQSETASFLKKKTFIRKSKFHVRPCKLFLCFSTVNYCFFQTFSWFAQPHSFRARNSTMQPGKPASNKKQFRQVSLFHRCVQRQRSWNTSSSLVSQVASGVQFTGQCPRNVWRSKTEQPPWDSRSRWWRSWLELAFDSAQSSWKRSAWQEAVCPNGICVWRWSSGTGWSDSSSPCDCRPGRRTSSCRPGRCLMGGARKTEPQRQRRRRQGRAGKTWKNDAGRGPHSRPWETAGAEWPWKTSSSARDWCARILRASFCSQLNVVYLSSSLVSSTWVRGLISLFANSLNCLISTGRASLGSEMQSGYLHTNGRDNPCCVQFTCLVCVVPEHYISRRYV